MRGLSLVAASGGHSSSRCAGLSPPRPLLLRSTGSRWAGSVAVAHGPSRSAACGIFPNQGLNPCHLHWQADSQPLRHQGSPLPSFLKDFFCYLILFYFWRIFSDVSRIGSFFPFCTLRVLFHCLLDHSASHEGSAVIFCSFLSNVMFFTPWFSSNNWFWMILIIIYLSVVFFMLLYLGFVELLGSVDV